VGIGFVLRLLKECQLLLQRARSACLGRAQSEAGRRGPQCTRGPACSTPPSACQQSATRVLPDRTVACAVSPSFDHSSSHPPPLSLGRGRIRSASLQHPRAKSHQVERSIRPSHHAACVPGDASCSAFDRRWSTGRERIGHRCRHECQSSRRRCCTVRQRDNVLSIEGALATTDRDEETKQNGQPSCRLVSCASAGISRSPLSNAKAAAVQRIK
jgi:hypothetical protein